MTKFLTFSLGTSLYSNGLRVLRASIIVLFAYAGYRFHPSHVGGNDLHLYSIGNMTNNMILSFVAGLAYTSIPSSPSFSLLSLISLALAHYFTFGQPQTHLIQACPSPLALALRRSVTTGVSEGIYRAFHIAACITPMAFFLSPYEIPSILSTLVAFSMSSCVCKGIMGEVLARPLALPSLSQSLIPTLTNLPIPASTASTKDWQKFYEQLSAHPTPSALPTTHSSSFSAWLCACYLAQELVRLARGPQSLRRSVWRGLWGPVVGGLVLPSLAGTSLAIHCALAYLCTSPAEDSPSGEQRKASGGVDIHLEKPAPAPATPRVPTAFLYTRCVTALRGVSEGLGIRAYPLRGELASSDARSVLPSQASRALLLASLPPWASQCALMLVEGTSLLVGEGLAEDEEGLVLPTLAPLVHALITLELHLDDLATRLAPVKVITVARGKKIHAPAPTSVSAQSLPVHIHALRVCVQEAVGRVVGGYYDVLGEGGE
eukprot:gene30194-36473_t